MPRVLHLPGIVPFTHRPDRDTTRAQGTWGRAGLAAGAAAPGLRPVQARRRARRRRARRRSLPSSSLPASAGPPAARPSGRCSPAERVAGGRGCRRSSDGRAGAAGVSRGGAVQDPRRLRPGGHLRPNRGAAERRGGDSRHGGAARPRQRLGRRLRRLWHLSRLRRPLLPARDVPRRARAAAAEGVFGRSFVVDQAEPIPTRPVEGIVDPPLLWRYFVHLPRRGAPARCDAARRRPGGAHRDAHQHHGRRRLRGLVGQEHGRLQGGGVPGGDRRLLPPRGVSRSHLAGPQPLSHEHAWLVGRRSSVRAPRLGGGAQRRALQLRHQPSLPGAVRLSLRARHRH